MSAIDHPPLHLQTTAGQALRIELTSMPGAGVVWQAPAAPAGCSLSATGSAPVGAGVGGAALQGFVLTCQKAGQQHLRFELKRPWESEIRAVQTVVVTVK